MPAANGRAACIASWARRSLLAATSFMARVICCVDLTERMRRRRSLMLLPISCRTQRGHAAMER